MTEAEFKQLSEVAWRRPLTAQEMAMVQAWLRAHPDASEDWALEMAAAQAIRKLPNAPVSSNFTAQVMEAVKREDRLTTVLRLNHWFRWEWRSWLPRLACALCLIALVFGFWRYYDKTQRLELVSVLTNIPRVANLSSSAFSPSSEMQVWQDFEIIRRLHEVVPDNELLTVLK